MDLYYAMTNYQLLECILHKIVLNKENKAVLLLSNCLLDDDCDMLDSVKETKVFDDVMAYDEVIFSHEKNINIEYEIKLICDVVKNKYGDLIKKSNSIYIGQDVDSLGVFLVSNGIDYYYLEDASGSYSNNEILLNVVKDENRNRYEIVKKLNLGGKSEYVKGIYCDFAHQKENFNDLNCTDFSVKDLLKKLNEKDLNIILRIYHCRKYNLKRKKKDLLLTWHYNNMNFMSLEEQKLFFTLLVDYFKMEDEMLFIKPHPSDRQLDYQECFEDAVVLERHMPSELLPFLVNDKFEKGITNWSTSIFGLQDILKEIINFDKDIDKTYKDFNKYFAIVKYLDSVKVDGRIQNLNLIEINEKQLLQLMKYYFEDYKRYYKISDAKSSIYIVHKYDSKYKNKKCLAIQKDKDCAFENLLSIKFGKKRECVYLYNLPFSEIQVKKVMKYSGCELEVNFISLNQYIDSLNQEILNKNKEIGMLKEEEKKKVEDLNAVVDDYKGRLEAAKKEINDIISSSSWKVTEPLRKLNSLRRKHEKRKD